MTDTSPIAQIDSYIAEQIQKQSIPGLSLAVVQHGQSVVERAYGVASVELGAAATPETVYEIQSITKAFVGLGYMMLVEEGRINLDDPLLSCMPDLPSTWSGITIRHLLAMTSGIVNMFQDHATLADGLAFMQLARTDAEIVQWAASHPLHFAPGSQYHYSPTNYHLLGMIMEQITGQPWYAFLEDRIFAPLHMTHTRVTAAHPIIPNRAPGYRLIDGALQNGEYQTPVFAASASGGLYSTVVDLAKWDAALYTEQLVSNDSLEQLWTPSGVPDFLTGDTPKRISTYGLGWVAEQHAAGRIVGHSGGNWTGYSAQIWRFVDQHLTTIVMTNLDSAKTSQMAKDVAALFLPTSEQG